MGTGGAGGQLLPSFDFLFNINLRAVLCITYMGKVLRYTGFGVAEQVTQLPSLQISSTFRLLL